MAADTLADLEWMVREHGPITFSHDGDSFAVHRGEQQLVARGPEDYGGLPVDSIGLAVEILATGQRLADHMNAGGTPDSFEEAYANGR